MVEFSVSLCLVFASFAIVNCVASQEPCESGCIKAEDCKFFGNLNKDEQTSWLTRFICDEPRGHSGKVFGFSSSAKGDIVCCPENVWQIEDPNQPQPEPNVQAETGSDGGVDLEKNSYQYRPNYNNYNYPNNNNFPSGNRRNQYDDRNGNQGWNNGGGSVDDEITAYENTRIWQNRHRQRPINNGENPYFIPANRNTGNSFRSANSGGQTGQCPVTSFPPDHNSGCCGREATEDDRIAASNPQNSWMPQQRPWRSYSDREKRDTSDVEVTLDNRIAGGRETDLEQFPWTVLLKTTFIYPDKESAFSCGGSLISSRYVLTAGHCVYDQKGSVKGVEVYLAEYDKRTFPQDCKNVLGRGQMCVENIIINAERVHIHPEYDDNRLRNDIAMLRLSENAPYTDYIRPICLPPINVDSPQLSHLRLAVAGWGRNGQYKSNIKQSTVVNLVPNRECAESYPGLTKNQLCAAGYTGEDTCKGDSGGPLMMVYGGKYYVSGVVSGKRADAPCGTSVPSLYTNVYQYLQWIRSVITN